MPPRIAADHTWNRAPPCQPFDRDACPSGRLDNHARQGQWLVLVTRARLQIQRTHVAILSR